MLVNPIARVRPPARVVPHAGGGLSAGARHLAAGLLLHPRPDRRHHHHRPQLHLPAHLLHVPRRPGQEEQGLGPKVSSHKHIISINNLWSPRSVPMWMRVYSWHMVIVGVGGGILSFVNAVMSVKDKLQEGESCWTVWIDSDSG